MDLTRHHAHRHHHSKRELPNMQGAGVPSRVLVERTVVHLVPRASCTSDDEPGCTKPTSVPLLPVVCAVVIPVVIIIVVLIYLHRRHLKKLREEDAKDKYKSMDFGVDPVGGMSKKGKRHPEMSLVDTEKSLRNPRQLSLDMDQVNSPYMMPAGLNSSRESFHSLSRSMNDPHDPYRQVVFGKDDASIRSSSRAGGKSRFDNGSMYTTSSGGTEREHMNSGLLKNAQRMSQSFPPRGESMSPPDIPEIRFPEPVAAPRSPLNPNGPLPPPPQPPVAFKSSESLGSALSSPEPTLPAVQHANAPNRTNPSPPPLPRIQSQQAVVLENANTSSILSDSSYGEGFKVTPPSPTNQQEHRMSDHGLVAPEPVRPQNDAPQNAGLGVEGLGFNSNRLSMSMRPLPPDNPSDNPEQRAERIRSFYKEYFDDSKPEPAGQYDENHEDYRSEYLDGAIFDPHTGAFVVTQPQAPYAEPITRRAMTPPPRAPPRFRSGSNPRGPHMSGTSNGSSRYIPPRGMSSMSGRMAPPGPRKPLPPPTPLSSLPTPSKLKEDSAIFNAMDFAPPVSFRDRQNGMRPDSPLGSPRPYSPSVRPHTPLAGSFDDLAVMPSPHMLRKSGAFTGLDFAPPPRFRDPEGSGSDAGSIRSNRSGMSAAGRMAVRTGAYRVSRIPKEVVGTRDDITAALRPKMNMVSGA